MNTEKKPRLLPYHKRFNAVRNVKMRLLRMYEEGFSEHRTFEWMLAKRSEIIHSLIDSGTWARIGSGYQQEVYAFADGVYEAFRIPHLVWTVVYNGNRVIGADIPDGEWDKVESDRGDFAYSVENGYLAFRDESREKDLTSR